MTIIFITLLSTYLLLSHAATTSYNEWQALSTKIPTANSVGGAAIAYGNEEIWIVGGSSPQQSLLSYNIATKSFTDHGDEWLSTTVYGRGQFYTQSANILYMINGIQTQSFIQFNTEQTTAIYDYGSIPLAVEYAACLASSSTYLFILGQGFGGDIALTNKVQILNMATNTWISNAPHMVSPRSQSACVVNGNYMYVIGGSGGLGSDNAPVYHNTVEKLLISDMSAISSESWDLLQNTLSHKVFGPRAVNHDTDILVIGGTDIPSWDFISDINVISTTTNSIRVDDGPGIGFGVSVASISVDDVLYVFNYRTNEIWYLDLTISVSTNTTNKQSSSDTEGENESFIDNIMRMDYFMYIVIGGSVVLLVLLVIICICCKKKKDGSRTVKLKKPKKIRNYQPKSKIKVESIWEVNENEDDYGGSTYKKQQVLSDYDRQTSAIHDISMRQLGNEPSQKLSSVFDDSASNESSDENLAIASGHERLVVNIKDAKHTKVAGFNAREGNKYK